MLVNFLSIRFMVDERRLSPMIIRMAKRTVYYPATKNQATDLLGGSRRVRSFRAAVLVNRKSLK
jgi:hypothetical protein